MSARISFRRPEEVARDSREILYVQAGSGAKDVGEHEQANVFGDGQR
jgi:hypothetical protein